MITDCTFSEDMKHRYDLYRIWNTSSKIIAFIGLNPSRADEIINDATIRRLMKFAESWGYGGIMMLNLYSFRTPFVSRKDITDSSWEPLDENLQDAYNDTTDMHIKKANATCDKVVVCCGAFDFANDRLKVVLSFINKPYCFGLNKNGMPKHPLYLNRYTAITPYNA